MVFVNLDIKKGIKMEINKGKKDMQYQFIFLFGRNRDMRLVLFC